VLPQLQALEHTTTAAIVRVESGERQRIHRVLDAGAEGIMCPRINTIDEARSVVSGLRYPPEGSRGVAKMIRATGFGNNFSEYRNAANDNILGVVQIETTEVLQHLDAIAALDGVDVLFIGPSDLSMSLGIFSQFDHPLYRKALKDTIDAAKKYGKATGILLFNPDDYNTYYEMGIRMIACGADASFVADGARNMSAKLSSIRTTLKN
jgi:4-hydroxy-2-oxoheptanedioate aldolase